MKYLILSFFVSTLNLISATLNLMSTTINHALTLNNKINVLIAITIFMMSAFSLYVCIKRKLK